MSAILIEYPTVPAVHIALLLNNLPVDYKCPIQDPRTHENIELAQLSEDGKSREMYISVYEPKNTTQRFTSTSFESDFTKYHEITKKIILPSLEDGNALGICEGSIAAWWESIYKYLKYQTVFIKPAEMDDALYLSLMKISDQFPIFSNPHNNCYMFVYKLLQKGLFDLYASETLKHKLLFTQKEFLMECELVQKNIKIQLLTRKAIIKKELTYFIDQLQTELQPWEA